MELNIKTEKILLKKELSDWFNKIGRHIANKPSTINEQIELLSLIRKDTYEDLNQLQHKGFILEIAEQLQLEFPQITKWTWHPKQTSHKDDADLTGFCENNVMLNVEVTTSQNPVGTIAQRMEKTLVSLSRKKGKLFYYVKTEKMLNRAKTKIKNNALKVEARQT
jgi:hypothetical protein